MSVPARPPIANLRDDNEVRYFRAWMHSLAGWRNDPKVGSTEFGGLRPDRAEAIRRYALRLAEDIAGGAD